MIHEKRGSIHLPEPFEYKSTGNTTTFEVEGKVYERVKWAPLSKKVREGHRTGDVYLLQEVGGSAKLVLKFTPFPVTHAREHLKENPDKTDFQRTVYRNGRFVKWPVYAQIAYAGVVGRVLHERGIGPKVFQVKPAERYSTQEYLFDGGRTLADAVAVLKSSKSASQALEVAAKVGEAVGAADGLGLVDADIFGLHGSNNIGENIFIPDSSSPAKLFDYHAAEITFKSGRIYPEPVLDYLYVNLESIIPPAELNPVFMESYEKGLRQSAQQLGSLKEKYDQDITAINVRVRAKK